MGMTDGPHRDAMLEAIALDADAQRLVLARDPAASGALRRAAARYRESWELAPPGSFGRLIGMLKALVLAGDADATAGARYVREQLGDGFEPDSAPSSYLAAIAALVAGEDAEANRLAEGMRGGPAAFGRTADAIAAVATRDRDAYRAALTAIVADFEGRDEHLTGVPIADTALMLERLAEPRGMAAGARSPLLPG